jgi:hypothetical protein
MVADFVAFGDAMGEHVVSCYSNNRRRSAATRFEGSSARRSDGGRVSLVCASNARRALARCRIEPEIATNSDMSRMPSRQPEVSRDI